MKNVTVTLGINEYNNLVDFKRDVEEGKSLIFNTSLDNEFRHNIVTTDEAIKSLVRINNKIADDYASLLEKHEALSNQKEPKKMSFWQWRKS
jgi:hypothetical protein